MEGWTPEVRRRELNGHDAPIAVILLGVYEVDTRPHIGRSCQEVTALKQTLQVAGVMDHICRRSGVQNCRFNREFCDSSCGGGRSVGGKTGSARYKGQNKLPDVALRFASDSRGGNDSRSALT